MMWIFQVRSHACIPRVPTLKQRAVQAGLDEAGVPTSSGALFTTLPGITPALRLLENTLY